MTEESQLPACQKCKLRKVRCDRQAPKCNNCKKGNVACIVIDPVTGEQYARDYIRQLEEKEQFLKQRLGDNATEGDIVDTPGQPGRSDGHDQTPTGPATAASAGSHGGFVGDGSGLGFLQNILSDAKWQHHRAHILSQLANRPRILKHHLAPNALPSLEEAQQLLDNYFIRFHTHHAFLRRQEVHDLFNRIYSPSTSTIRPSAQDYYRLLMVFAISETTRHRAGQGPSAEYPYGYYLAAETYLSSIPLIKDPEAIQNLLLIARFGMYHHIGTSIWEISRLCMRQCIEWRLHLKSTKPLEPITEQHHRRIFWECYVHDRYSSGILGRPFAILESEIHVPLPIDADDESILASNAKSLDNISSASPGHPTEVSVNLFCIKLRRISSRVHSAFYTGRNPASHSARDGTRTPDFRSIGHVYSCFSQFHKELDTLRASAPVFENPRCLYEQSEWHDFMYEKDRLLLARGAMYNVPGRPYSSGGVIKEILTACYTSATRTIELYADLRSKKSITWTRSYFQVIFTAGLTVIYCVSLDVLKDFSESDLSQTDPLRALNLCSTVLNLFKEKMPDAGSFAVVFDVMKEECIKDRFAGSFLPSVTTITDPTSIDNTQQALDLPTSHLHQTHPVSFDTLHPSLDGSTGSVLLPTSQQHTNIDHFMPHSYPDATTGNAQIAQDFGLGLTDDLMNQLEAGLGEYAWGTLNMDVNFWDQFGFE